MLNTTNKTQLSYVTNELSPIPEDPTDPTGDAVTSSSTSIEIGGEPGDAAAEPISPSPEDPTSPEEPLHTPFGQRPVHPVILVLIALIVTLAGLWRWSDTNSTYLVLSPGPVLELPQRISGPVLNPGFRHHRIAYLTVKADQITWGRYLWRHDVEHSSAIFVHAASSSAFSLEVSEMNQAKQTAAVLAQYLATGKNAVLASGAEVLHVTPGLGAAVAGIRAGDVISKVASVPIANISQIRPLVAAYGPRGEIPITITRAGWDKVLLVKITHLSAGYRIGVDLVPHDTLNPKDKLLTVNTSGVEGPSGGLMFTLAMIDALSPGDLTGGKFITGTGTIDPYGNVGPIGDVTLKTQAAIAAHAQIFFTDPIDYVAASATARGSSLHVVKVASVFDALLWLCQHGAHDTVCANLPLVEHRLIAIGGLR